jgi:DNA-binding NarL/FixJ family response regulator
MYDDAKFIKEVMNKCNGDAYFLKTNPYTELLEAINIVMDGEIYLSAGLKVFPKDILQNGDGEYEDEFQLRHRLTPRETQILHMISMAKSNKEIAEELFISDQTVMVHRKNIMRKLNLSNTAGLIKFALDHDLS